ncbi:MAG: type II toxin-antitoxin system CcdA family antitoxin [Bdellovibrionales bacterium]|nr:type II toxin-antitoxin system CcdA family antitoxin [Bdellovibrionales bacterium]
MPKKAYTVTLDEDVAERAQQLSDNFSGLVTSLLRKLIADTEREEFIESLKRYDEEAEERRKRLGIFGEKDRTFL